MNKTFKMNYFSRDFASIKNDLKEYAKRYYSNELSDLSESSINSFLMESVAYAGDILSYYLDYQTNEAFLSTAVESKNILSLAKSLGYKRRDFTTTTGKIAIYMLLPNDGTNKPDYSKSPTIRKGTEVGSSRGNSYIITEDIRATNNVIGDNYVVANTNTLGNPTFYAIKMYAPIISGQIKTTNVQVSQFVKFNKILLNDPKIAEILSIIDSDGNEYYEVSNLTQNIIYKSVYNQDSEPRYILKPMSAQRRFVFDYDTALPYLLFGGKQYRPDDFSQIDPILEPSKYVLNKYNNDFLQDEYFEPNSLLNGDSYGIGPENTILTIKYRLNTTNNNNSAIGEVNTIKNLLFTFHDQNISQQTQDTILNSIQITNEESIIGENVIVSLEDIKDLAGTIYNSQNRAVTAKDYEALAYMMHQKYGAIKRVKALRDPTSLKNNINLYIICTDQRGNFIKSNSIIKENLKNWLSNYKILTDTVDILDAKVINFGINFTIFVDPRADKIETLNNVLEQLRSIYAAKSHIGESFNILDVYREIRNFRNVLDVKEVKIRNIVGTDYSNIPFNVQQNLTSDGNLIQIPKNAIYEIKYPSLDIIGNAI